MRWVMGLECMYISVRPGGGCKGWRHVSHSKQVARRCALVPMRYYTIFGYTIKMAMAVPLRLLAT